jgi:hypothetical protein
MAMALVIASPAGVAGRPPCPDGSNQRPCPTEPVDDQGGGITCAEHATSKLQENLITDLKAHDDHFDIELRGKNVRACIDVMADEGVWTVDIQLLEGTVRSMGLIPRDSVAPGDSCGGVILSRPDLPLSIDLPQVPPPDYDGPNPDIDGDGNIEGSYANSCGESFGEWVDVKVDGVEKRVFYEKENTNIPSPLAFQASMAGSKDAHVILHVHVPAYTPPTP